MLLLRILEDGAAARSVPVEEVPFTIGREAGNDLVIDDERVSRKHAQLELHGDRVVLRDLDSRNGTFVADVRIEGGSWLTLPARFRVGRTELELTESVDSSATMELPIQGATPTATAAGTPRAVQNAATPGSRRFAPPWGRSAAGRTPSESGAADDGPRWGRSAAGRTPSEPGAAGDRLEYLLFVRLGLGGLGALWVAVGTIVLAGAMSEGVEIPPLLLLAAISQPLVGVLLLGVAIVLPRRDPRVWMLTAGSIVAGTIVLILGVIVSDTTRPQTPWLPMLVFGLAGNWLARHRAWYRKS